MNFEGISKLTKTIGAGVVKNSPTILTGLSVTGVIATTFLGGKGAIKAFKIIEEESYVKREGQPGYYIELPPKDIVKATWKCFIPTAIMGGVTIACIIGGHSINTRRNAALAGAYSLADTALKEYKAKVVEKIGENKEREIRDDINKDKIEKDPVSNHEVIITGRGHELCYDAFSGRYFKSSIEVIEAALNKLSRKLMTENWISLNQVYSELDLEGTKMGDVLGWHVDFVGSDLIRPSFSSNIADDGRPCLVLDFEEEPKYLNRDY